MHRTYSYSGHALSELAPPGLILLGLWRRNWGAVGVGAVRLGGLVLMLYLVGPRQGAADVLAFLWGYLEWSLKAVLLMAAAMWIVSAWDRIDEAWP